MWTFCSILNGYKLYHEKRIQMNKYWIEDNDFCDKSTTDAFVNCDRV